MVFKETQKLKKTTKIVEHLQEKTKNLTQELIIITEKE